MATPFYSHQAAGSVGVYATAPSQRTESLDRRHQRQLRHARLRDRARLSVTAAGPEPELTLTATRQGTGAERAGIDALRWVGL